MQISICWGGEMSHVFANLAVSSLPVVLFMILVSCEWPFSKSGIEYFMLHPNLTFLLSYEETKERQVD